MITQARLKELVHYEPDTGVFTYLDGRSPPKLPDQKYYRVLALDGRDHYAHRLAWLYQTGEFPPEFIDHANGDKQDNRFANLRAATKQQNHWNSPKYKNNKSGLKGAYFSPQRNRWMSDITVNKKTIHLGAFPTAEDAHAAYCAAARQYFGEFARTA